MVGLDDGSVYLLLVAQKVEWILDGDFLKSNIDRIYHIWTYIRNAWKHTSYILVKWGF